MISKFHSDLNSFNASGSLSITIKCPALASSVERIVLNLSSKLFLNQGAFDLSSTFVTAIVIGSGIAYNGRLIRPKIVNTEVAKIMNKFLSVLNFLKYILNFTQGYHALMSI